MVTEVFVFKIDPARANEFEKMYTEVISNLRAQAGYRSEKLMRAIERPEQYILAVEWDSVKAHQAFIASASYPKMSGPFGEFVKEGDFAHYTTIASN